MNFGVPWNGRGGEFDTGTSSPQESNIFHATFGSNHKTECVSAHLTRNIGLNADERSSAEKLVTAIGFGIHDELGTIKREIWHLNRPFTINRLIPLRAKMAF